MDFKTLVPVVVTAVSALLGFVVWIIQKNVERRHAERLRKEALYENLLESVIHLRSFGDGAPFLIESQKAWLYATDNVLYAINDYLKVFLKYPTSQGEASSTERREALQAAEGEIRLQIRRDLFPKTIMNSEWLRTHWEPIAAPKESIHDYLSRMKDK